MRKTALFLLIQFLALPSAFGASFERISRSLEKALLAAQVKSVAVLPFSYLDLRESEGPWSVQEQLTSVLSKIPSFLVTKSSTVAEIVKENNILRKSWDTKEALETCEALRVDGVIFGDLKDVKNMAEVHVLAVSCKTGRLVGGANEIIPKSWKDAEIQCGSLQYLAITTESFSRVGDPSEIQIIFSAPWWSYIKLGTVSWDFCKPGVKAPNLNQALGELKKKAWESGGKAIYFIQNQNDALNPKVLHLHGEVLR